MSALAVEPSSLELDFAPLGSALLTLGASVSPLMSYVNAVRAIPMGEQPIILDGKVAGKYDALAKRPELKAALYGVIHRANEIAGHMDTLHIWAGGGATKLIEEIVPPLEKVRAILAATPAGAAISAADQQTVREQMQRVSVFTMMAGMVMTQVGTGMHNFLSNIGVDHDTLAGGPYELRKVADELGKQISDEAMPYVLNPIYRGIGETMLQIGRVFIAAINHLSTVLGNALAGHEAMGGTASALAVAASSAHSKYEAAANAVAASDAATMSVTLRKLQLSAAIQSWKQFADFFTRSGL
jgi:hypothetical protein